MNDGANKIHDNLIASLDFLVEESQRNTESVLLDHCGYRLMMVTAQFLSGVTLHEAEGNLALCMQLNKYIYDLLVAGTNDDKRIAKSGLGHTMQQLSETIRNLNPENEVVQRLENKMLLAINSIQNN